MKIELVMLNKPRAPFFFTDSTVPVFREFADKRLIRPISNQKTLKRLFKELSKDTQVNEVEVPK